MLWNPASRLTSPRDPLSRPAHGTRHRRIERATICGVWSAMDQFTIAYQIFIHWCAIAVFSLDFHRDSLLDKQMWSLTDMQRYNVHVWHPPPPPHNRDKFPYYMYSCYKYCAIQYVALHFITRRSIGKIISKQIVRLLCIHTIMNISVIHYHRVRKNSKQSSWSR